MPGYVGFAFASALLYAGGMIFMRVGLRHLPVRAGAAIGVPATAIAFWLFAPFTVDPAGAVAPAVALFALVGLFFPAAVTLIMYESNRRLGPTAAATASSVTPLFAMAAAVAVLGESMTAGKLAGTLLIVAAVWLLAQRGARSGAVAGWALALPLGGALIRAVAQAASKAGLVLWPSPFGAALIGYTVSAVVLIALRLRAPGSPGRRKGASPNAKREGNPVDPRAVALFVAVGLCNGGAVLTMNFALLDGPVSVVSPIIAAHPLFTLLLGAIFLRDERVDARLVAGTLLTLGGVALLVGAA